MHSFGVNGERIPPKPLIADKYQGFIFDLDHTLVKTQLEGYIIPCIKETVQILGGTIVSDDEILNMWLGRCDRNQFIRTVFGLDPKKFWANFRFQDTPTKRKNRTEPFAWAVSALECLRAFPSNKKLGILTAAHPPIMEVELDILGRDIFDLAISVTEHPNFLPKPNPTVISHISRTWRLRRDQLVMIGDALEDGQLAKNAKIDFVHFSQNGLVIPSAKASFSNWLEFLSIRL